MSFYEHSLDRWHSLHRDMRELGVITAVANRIFGRYNKFAQSRGLRTFWPTVSVRVPGCRTKVLLRLGSSDRDVLRQVFFNRQYAPLDQVPARFVLDCG